MNHARYLAVLALGAFALPMAATMLEWLGAPRAPAGVSALLLAVVLIVAILIDRPGGPQAVSTAERRALSPRPRTEAEDPGARL